MLKVFNDENSIKKINNTNNFIFAFSTTDSSVILKQIIDINIKEEKNINIILLTRNVRRKYFNMMKRFVYIRNFKEIKLKNIKEIKNLNNIFFDIPPNKNVCIINEKKILELVNYLKKMLPEHKVFITIFSDFNNNIGSLNNNTTKIIKELNQNQIFFNIVVSDPFFLKNFSSTNFFVYYKMMKILSSGFLSKFLFKKNKKLLEKIKLLLNDDNNPDYYLITGNEVKTISTSNTNNTDKYLYFYTEEVNKKWKQWEELYKFHFNAKNLTKKEMMKEVFNLITKFDDNMGSYNRIFKI